MIKLQYSATLQDISEPQIRHYLRGKSFRRQRIAEPVRTAILACATVYLLSLIRDMPTPWWLYLLAFILGYAVIFVTIRDTVSKRITKHIKRELGDKLPLETTFLVGGGEVRCSCHGSQIVFGLDHLSKVSEDKERLELDFGEAGLCTIPLRAFESDEQKDVFIMEINAVPPREARQG